jgi:hypothetical protein
MRLMSAALVRLLVALSLSAAAPAAIRDLPGVPQVRVEISRRGDAWTADFIFDRRVTAWVFTRSGVTSEDGKPWRQHSWTFTTPGVRVERRGGHDVLRAERGELPTRVSMTFRPMTKNLRADYTPALAFSDGSVALYTGQFDCFPMDSMSAVAKLPGDLNNVRHPAAERRFVFRDAAGPLLFEGRRVASVETPQDNDYVLFGGTRALETPDMVAILDPQLPDWIKDSLAHSVPVLFSRYTQELGRLPNLKPTLMATWAGPTPQFVSRNGSVLRGLITLNYEGAGMLAESDTQRHQGLWFIAHEAAHFWLGQAVGYEYARDAWITEGGAELLAFRSVAEVDPQFDPRPNLNRAIADCIELTRGRGVEGARERGEQRAYYACGTVFGLVAEAGSGRSFYKFVRQLVDGNRGDRVVSRADWLAALDAATRKPVLGRDIAQLLDRGAPDPGDFITDLLVRAGVNIETDVAGMPTLR